MRRVVDEEGHDEEGSARRGDNPTRRFYPTRSSTDEEDALAGVD
jgi:hypothetical protein